jgi:hypothetical protein
MKFNFFLILIQFYFKLIKINVTICCAILLFELNKKSNVNLENIYLKNVSKQSIKSKTIGTFTGAATSTRHLWIFLSCICFDYICNLLACIVFARLFFELHRMGLFARQILVYSFACIFYYNHLIDCTHLLLTKHD